MKRLPRGASRKQNYRNYLKKTAWYKEKISNGTPNGSLQYIDQLVVIELDCLHHETEANIEIKKLAEPFILEELLEFKEAFQKNLQGNKGIYVYLIVVKLYFYFI